MLLLLAVDPVGPFAGACPLFPGAPRAAAAEYDKRENIDSKPEVDDAAADPAPAGGVVPTVPFHPAYGPLFGACPCAWDSVLGGVVPPLPNTLEDPGEARLGGGGSAWIRE
jgi:hypothetical protein